MSKTPCILTSGQNKALFGIPLKTPERELFKFDLNATLGTFFPLSVTLIK